MSAPSSTSILYNAPAGYAGSVTRPDVTWVETLQFAAANYPLAFGAPYKLVSGEATKIASNDAATVFAGIISRTAPSESGSLTESLNSGVPNPDAPQGGLVRGYGNVVCAVGTPVRGGQVFMRVVADTGKAVGDFEATFDGGTPTVSTMTGTGNATCGTVTLSSTCETGVYKILMTAATKFNLQTPSGVVLMQGTLGTAYSAGGLAFTVTAGGTAAVAGDYITITVARANVTLSGVTWAVDGKDSSNVSEIRIF